MISRVILGRLWPIALGLAVAMPVSAQALDADRAGSGHGGIVQPDIIDGRPSEPGRWPFTVSLARSTEPDNRLAHYCGGTLLDAYNVLTAAHCVLNASADDFQVVVGTQDLASGGRRVAVSRVTWHPSFVRRTTLALGVGQYDVAVLRLATPVTDIPPVRIASSVAEEEAYSTAGDLLLVMGWGSRGTDIGPELLYETAVPKNTRASCNSLRFYRGRLTNVNLCAGTIGGGVNPSACSGDSGGPLISRGPNGQALQIGIVSGGPPVPDCGTVPGYYSRVGALANWIRTEQARP